MKIRTLLFALITGCGAGSQDVRNTSADIPCTDQTASGAVDNAGNLIVTCGSAMRIIPRAQWLDLAGALQQTVPGAVIRVYQTTPPAPQN